jgi:hypothetical protein
MQPNPPIGSFGVCLNDPNNPPRFFTLLAINGGIGFFAPANGTGNNVEFAIIDFWPLT